MVAAKKGIHKHLGKVIQFDRNGNFVAEYLSVTQAAKNTGILISSIKGVVYGGRRATNGYVFKQINTGKEIWTKLLMKWKGDWNNYDFGKT